MKRQRRVTLIARGYALFALVGVALLCVRSALAEPSDEPTRAHVLEASPVIVPRASSPTDVPYPEHGQGDADVLLELVIDVTGRVGSAALVSGEEPFASSALRAAASWLFLPATRSGQPVPARVRFQVHFSEPPPPVLPPEPTTASAPSGAVQAALPEPRAPDKPIVLTVEGQRDPHAKTLSAAEVRQLPGAFGDPFRAIEALPGVTPVASGAPYFYVRGSPPGNVGYFFDGVRVPVLFHAAAGPSVIHPAFVDEVKLYSGGYPARYGRFAGGIVTAEATQPEHRFHGQASVRLVDSGGMLEAPFASGRGDLQLAGRYSYTAAIVSALVPQLSLAYWDYQGRIAYDLTSKDRVSVFVFGSLDSAAQQASDGNHKRTIYATRFNRYDLRYDRRVSASATLRVAATVGSDRTLGEDDSYTVRDTLRAGRVEYRDHLSDTLQLEAGADLSLDSYRLDTDPSQLSERSQNIIYTMSSHDDVSSGAYLGLTVDAGSGVSVSPGLRADLYRSAGRAAFALEPRISARYRVGRHVSLLDDFGLAHQLPSFVAPVPGFQPDLGSGLQLAVQSSSGIELELPDDTRATLTAFHNALFNGTDRLGVLRLNSLVTSSGHDPRALGETEGLELMLERKLTRKLGGFLAYTLSRSRRALMDVEGPSAYDRTHVLNLALTWDFGRSWRAGARAMFYTGIPARVAYSSVARHPPRTRPFYRFDWRLEKRWLVGTSGGYWAFVIEVLNTTLNQEMLAASCSALRCSESNFGPVTVPSIGVEAGF